MSKSTHAAGALALVPETSPAAPPSAPASAPTDAIARAFIGLLKKDAGVVAQRPRSTAADDIEDPALRELLLGLDDAEDEPASPVLRADLAAAGVLLARAVGGQLHFIKELKSGAPVATISTGNSDLNGLVQKAVTVCLIGSCRRALSDGERLGTDRNSVMIVTREEGDRRTDAADRDVGFCVSKRIPLIGIAADARRDLSRDLNRVASHRLTLPGLDASLVALVIEAVYGAPPSRPIDPGMMRLLDVSDFGLAFRPDLDPDAALARLEALLAEKTKFDAAGPALEELVGYGEAKRWGLDLVADLDAFRAGVVAWSEIDGRGLLLSGPPGVGKTSFAKALSKSARVPLIAASVAQWNAATYLSGTLAAIRKTFASARKVAPCVLLIDELDGISDRARLTGEYVEYWTQIVNCLLEELAGVDSRDGVVVIGCSNFPDKIDPAIRRAGRLDREIRVELPNAEDLAQIFRHHLGPEVLAGADLMPLAVRAAGKSGADVEAFSRRAKAAARRAKRDLTLDDVLAEIAGKDSEPLTPAFKRMLGVHEAGHAAVGIAFGHDVEWMKIDAKGGMTAVKAPERVPTLATAGEDLAVLLAGQAAEQVLLGTVAIPINSLEGDLARATMEALSIETVSGQGLNGPVYLPPIALDGLLLLRNPELHQAVRARLDEAELTARQFIARHRPAVEALAQALAESGYVGKEAILTIAAAHGLKPPNASPAAADEATGGAA